MATFEEGIVSEYAVALLCETVQGKADSNCRASQKLTAVKVILLSLRYKNTDRKENEDMSL
jgi:hypothetical protein